MHVVPAVQLADRLGGVARVFVGSRRQLQGARIGGFRGEKRLEGFEGIFWLVIHQLDRSEHAALARKQVDGDRPGPPWHPIDPAEHRVDLAQIG